MDGPWSGTLLIVGVLSARRGQSDGGGTPFDDPPPT